MSDTKLSALTALAKADFAADDLMYVADVSAGASGSKNVTLADILGDATSILITSSGTNILNFGTAATPVLKLDQATASAITGITITSAASGNGVTLTATGGTNESIKLVPKGTGSVLFPDGAVATPAIAFAAEPGTGFYRPASGHIATGIGGNTPFYLAGAVLNVGQNGSIGFSATGATATAETALVRKAANVMGMNSGSWFQNTPGSSRVKTSDVTTVSVTPAAITGLSATTIAGRGYSGELVLYLDDATAADGIRIDFDGGAGTWTSFIAQGMVTDTVSTRNLARTTAIATDLVDATTTGSAVVIIKFSGVANAGGTFIPRLAKSTDAAGATLTCRVGSYMSIQDMP